MAFSVIWATLTEFFDDSWERPSEPSPRQNFSRCPAFPHLEYRCVWIASAFWQSFLKWSKRHGGSRNAASPNGARTYVIYGIYGGMGRIRPSLTPTWQTSSGCALSAATPTARTHIYFVIVHGSHLCGPVGAASTGVPSPATKRRRLARPPPEPLTA